MSEAPLDLLDLRFRGLVLPCDKKPEGFFQTSYTREIIRASILMIFNTRLGERVMTPEFGSRLYKLIFEPNDALLRQLASRYVIDDLKRWEPRVKVTSIRTASSEHELQIHIDYNIVSLSIEDAVTLVFPRQEPTSRAT